ncbi:carboxymuconolactone decarboxylase family protein [Ornithinibacillus sp. L9]|uniref:Carboxymuconolactone decarboxylase family protein n=1 Tax=Ornithinibacillus caprae TaxID=2678566 RepID=A0A6N8FLN2_9BACI|nr:carboxymuconolactone decarboxylase family protein [Ornithinibacillus caprae]MUK88218.1 carboxymuconolactone decarboxylase family protein [Ornithinibacillus caprae]
MVTRINYGRVAPDALKLLIQLDAYKKETRFDEKLIHLIKIRASQLNRCAFCINMHTKEAIQAGETEQRIFCLDAWEETALYTNQERAVLALTEAVTHISENGVTDELYQEVRKYFDEKETIDLVMLIIIINSWNRLSIANKNGVSKS